MRLVARDSRIQRPLIGARCPMGTKAEEAIRFISYGRDQCVRITAYEFEVIDLVPQFAEFVCLFRVKRRGPRQASTSACNASRTAR